MQACYVMQLRALLRACCDACMGMGGSPGGLPTTTWRHSLLAPFNKSVAISTYSEYSPPCGHEALLLVQGDEAEGRVLPQQASAGRAEQPMCGVFSGGCEAVASKKIYQGGGGMMGEGKRHESKESAATKKSESKKGGSGKKGC